MSWQLDSADILPQMCDARVRKTAEILHKTRGNAPADMARAQSPVSLFAVCSRAECFRGQSGNLKRRIFLEARAHQAVKQTSDHAKRTQALPRTISPFSFPIV